MPQTGEVLAGNLYLKLSSDGGTTHDVAGCMRDVQLTFDFPTVDVGSQGSGGYQKLKAGRRKSMSGSCSGVMRFTDASGEVNADDIFTLADDGTEVPFLFEPETAGVGDVTYSGTVLITNLQIGGSDDAEATYSFSLSSTGVFGTTVGEA
ncbi:phage tail tube protein [Roseivirga pacifica]|uniref:phage tail tube protein n=1 Tax=Roseivirga pacifica TaxID=1267423 RepID=UPI00209586B7|nr:phage tail tube protein [Roseivirga pacifica]MCO6358545.1 hypothetical protein [Roseivirga pacifica]MCO6369100.1 hypothetical protein [Roseivirga pacifica]MCO6372196.1 hypothetical protein [Roseivirga pacifica]MCO6374276.1 hypothetical protein [Roseivirga pacifica]MCO6380927.1 hypothetical protein [Roseivirga pacifica]